MATTSWTYDAASGVLKNHALSSKLRFAAIREAKFMQFAMTETGYGKGKGESLTIVRVDALSVPTSDVLNELDTIPEDKFVISLQSVTAVEHGRAVPYTNLYEQLASFDLSSSIQRVLKDQLTLSLDASAAAAAKLGQIKYSPTGISAATVATNGTAGATASANLNTYHVEAIRDLMYSTYNMPRMSGDGADFVAILSTKAKRGIISDPKWEEWHKYTDADSKYAGEIGRYENIRFIEDNNTAVLSSSLGTGAVLGEAIFFADDAIFMGSVMDPELRAKENTDYGRSKGVAWYGIYGFAQVWSNSANPGQARTVHVTSL